MPYLLDGFVLEVSDALYGLYHCLVEVAEIMIAQLLVVNKVPLATCVFVAPSITFAREVDPFRMTKLVAHEVQISTVDG